MTPPPIGRHCAARPRRTTSPVAVPPRGGTVNVNFVSATTSLRRGRHRAQCRRCQRATETPTWCFLLLSPLACDGAAAAAREPLPHPPRIGRPAKPATSAIDLSCLANHPLAHGGSDANRHDVQVPTQGPGPGGPPRYHHRSATPRTGASAPLAGCAHRAGRRTHVSSGGVGVGETASAARFRSGGLTVGAPVPATSSRPCLQQTCHAKCSLRAPGSPALSSRTRPCSSTTSTTTASLRGFAACPRRANCSNRSGTSTVRGLSTSNA